MWNKLNDTIELPINPLNGFKSIYSHHPSGNKHGGVALFYKENLALFERNDLSFDECIVTEIHIGRKKVFFTVIYRSPNDKAGSPEFERFLKDDFNAHSQNWWPDGNTSNEGIAIDNLLSALIWIKLYVNPQILKKRKIPLVLI